MLPLLLLYVVTVVTVHAALSPLNSVSREKSGVNEKALNGTFGRMLLNSDGTRDGRMLIVASSNRLVQFDYQLNEIAVEVDAPKRERHTYCYNSRGSEENCYNHYRVLLIGDYKGHQSLLACGTNAYNPECTWRKLSNLSVMAKFSGRRICPQDPNYQNVAVFGGGALYTGIDPNVDITDDDALMKLMKDPFLKTMMGNRFLNSPTFVAAFPVDNFMYFVFRELADSVPEEAVYSRVARVCLHDKPNELIFTEQFSSFMKARILCEVPGGVDHQPYRYDRIIDVLYHEGSVYPSLQDSRLMYAIFSTPSNAPSGSALCVYSFDDTTARKHNLRTIFDGPFLYRNDQQVWKTGQPPQPYRCREGGPPRDARVAHQYYLMRSALQQSTERPLLVLHGVRFNALAVDRVQTRNTKNSYDVIFIGTDDGRVLKVVNLKDGLVVVEEILVLQGMGNESGGTICGVKGDRKFTLKLDSQMGLFFVAISKDNTIMTLPVQRCHLHTNCKQCLSAQDPYCGWCYGTKLCTVQNSCGGTWTQSVETGALYSCENFADQPPKITTFPPGKYYYKERLSSLTFECRATGVPVPTVRWVINDNRITPGTAYNIDIADFDGGYSRLFMKELNMHNGGTYECVAQNRLGEVQMKTEVLIVAKPRIVENPVSKNVIRGRSAVFHCPVVGEPLAHIIWLFRRNEGSFYLPTKRLKGISNKRLELSTNGTLVLLDVTEANDGKYGCRALNDYGTVTSDWAILTVKVAPRMKQLSPNKTNIYLTDTQKAVVLRCPVIMPKGHAFPVVSWFHNGLPLTLTDNIVTLGKASVDKNVKLISPPPSGVGVDNANAYPGQIQYQQYYNGSLLIRPFKNDSGAWECRASNDVGQAVLYPAYKLVIEETPNQQLDRKFQLDESPEDFEVTVGQPAKFHCSVNSWFKPSYAWYRGGKKIKQDNGPRYYISRDNSLLIFDAKKEDRGVYKCNVKSRRFPLKPTLEAKVTLTVRTTGQQPAVSAVPPTPTVLVPKSRLMCTIVSVESNSSSVSKVRRFASASVRLSVDDIAEDREFTCVSRKDTGVGNITAQMDIVPFPRFLEMPAPMIAVWNTDYEVTLHCRAECPPLYHYKIVWTADGEEMNDLQSKYHIIRSNKEKCESRLTVTIKNDQAVLYKCWFRDQEGGGAFGSRRGAVFHQQAEYPHEKNQLTYFAMKHSQLTVVCPQPQDQPGNDTVVWSYHPPNEYRPIDKEPLLTEYPDGSLRISNMTKEVFQSFLKCRRRKPWVKITFKEFKHEDKST